MKTRCLRLLLLIILMNCMCAHTIFATAQKTSLVKNEEKTVIIRLKDQFDVVQYKSKMAGVPSGMRKSFAIKAMKDFSAAAQERFLKADKILSASLTEVKTFWVANVIRCKATAEVIAQLEKRNDVESITLESACKVIDDTDLLKVQLDEPDVAKNVSMVRALEANKYGYTGKGVVVAVLDTGANYDHEDLVGRLWTNDKYPNHGYDFINGDNDPRDDNGHGTHCAGTVLGNGQSGVITGMAPEATLMILKILDKNGNGTESTAWEAIEFAVENGADVMSMSAGWRLQNKPDKKTWRDIMVNLLSSNILFVVAAGNEGGNEFLYPIPDNVRVPGNCPAAWINPGQPNAGATSSVITVGAVNEKGTNLLGMSSVGPATWQNIESYKDYPYKPGDGLIKPDVVAPGENVLSLDYKTNRGYASMSGTSMATPCVAGVVAKMLSKNKDLTPTDIVRVLSESAVKMDPLFNNKSGAGRIDALRATLYTPNKEVNCVSFKINETAGFANTLLNPGDEASISLEFRNNMAEEYSGCEVEIVSLSDAVTVVRKSEATVSITPDGTTQLPGVYSLKVASDAATGKIVDFAVILKKGDKTWTNLFTYIIYKAELVTDTFQIKEIKGNNNGMADKGEEIELVFPISNIGNETAENVDATITWESPYLSMLGEGTVRANIEKHHEFSFRFNVSGTTPDWQTVPLTLKLKGDNADTMFNYTFYLGKVAVLIVNRAKNELSARDFENVIKNKSYLSYKYTTETPDSLAYYQSVWFFSGVYPMGRKVVKSEKTLFDKYIQNGGRLYLEGGDVWYDRQVPIKDLFHIETNGDNGGELDSIYGCRKDFNESNRFKYSYDYSSIDDISPIEPATAFYKNSNPEFVVTVGYNGETSKTIGSSFEIGGVIEGNSSAVVDEYLEFFGLPYKEGSGIVKEQINENNYGVECYRQGDYCMIKLNTDAPVNATVSIYSAEGILMNRVNQGNASGNTTLSIPVGSMRGVYFIKVEFDNVEKRISRKVIL